MYAIAKITCGKNDRLGAAIYNERTGDTGFYWIEDRDNCGAEIGDTVLISFHPDDQFAQYIPLEAIREVILSEQFTVKDGMIVKKPFFHELNVFDPKNA